MTHTDEPSPEFYANVVREMRRHWVDAAAEREGLEPRNVTTALVLLRDNHAEVRINESVRAAVYIGDDAILNLNAAAARASKEQEIRGIVPDVPPDVPFMIFDLRLGYVAFDLQPRRGMAERHLTTGEQFMHAARDLVGRGALNAACENLFAAAELATMALMEVSVDPGFGHRLRSEWLNDHAGAVGLSAVEAAALGDLLEARNSYRYGDQTAAISPLAIIDYLPNVETMLSAARNAVRDNQWQTTSTE